MNLEINFEIEQILQDYKDSQYKNNRYISSLNSKINFYKIKMNKINVNNLHDDLKERANIYIDTCSGMIKIYEYKIEEKKKVMDDDFSHLKRTLKRIIRSAKYNNLLFLIKNNDYYIYNLPSAKIIIYKPEILINDENELKSFLFSNDIGVFNENGEIDINEFGEIIVLNEDGTLMEKNTGLIIDGCISDFEIDVNFVK